MQLLNDLIELAVDDRRPIATVLRRGLVLASILQNNSLKQWINKELNGYPNDLDLPEYRKAMAHAKGTFMGPGGSILRNRIIPPSALEQEDRIRASQVFLIQPISAYEKLGDTGKNPVIHWPSDLVAYYQTTFIQYFALTSAWQEIPSSHIVSLVETVRNRLLELSLELQSEMGLMGSDDLKSIPKERVEPIVTNHIYGGNNIISGQARDVVQNNNMTISQGDFSSLSRALMAAGIPEPSVESLKQSIDTDRQGRSPPMGGEVRNWLTGINRFLGPVAAEVATKAVESYLGLS